MGEATEQIERDLAERLATLGGFDVTIEGDPGETIVPRVSVEETLHSGVRPRAQSLAAAPWSAPERALELRATLGEGGMGMVHLGLQRSLGRRVAVKAIKPDLRNDESVEKLVNEARITGYLEHPNIVPVHEIATDPDGAPMIILKRIEGVHWGELIHREDELRRRFDVEDPLEWHLRVLTQVCNAVHFANRRGVLHRDLKPENVMVGEFGEVYLLDWGLAVRLDTGGDGSSALEGAPRASEATRMAGTPSYMAPEMLGGAPSRLSERTDVYLLGAVLYEILAGAPPHQGETLMQVLVSVSKSCPAPPAGPEELAAIARRAMCRDPNDRFSSADALRQAIEDYLSHRGSIRLAEKAEQALPALASASAVEQAQARFAECRFGFEMALEQWPENARAKDGLRAARIAMAERLAQDDPRAAARMLDDVDAAPDELVATIEAALAAERGERDELARVRRELDPAFGRRIRVVASVVLGVWWTLGPLVGGSLGLYGHDVASLAGPPALVLPLFALATWRFRDVALRTVLNRQLLGAAALVMVAEVTLHGGGALGGLGPAQTHAISLVVFSVVTAAMGLMVSPLLFVPAAAYLLAFLTALVVPDARFVAQAVGNLVMTVVVLRVWLHATHPLRLRSSAPPAL